MGPSFNQQFDQHGQWRKSFAGQLAALQEWLSSQDLLDAAVQDHLQRLEQQVRGDQVSVAFVAEFSRGKSELINAVFFAHYGRRIMPASPGRTTMCPTELGWDPALAPCLRLLPIESREQPLSLAEWRARTGAWTHFSLDVSDPDQLAATLARVAEVRKVTVDKARSLGFWHDSQPQDNPIPDAQGLVDVPVWRHALVNLAHPLLKQGLVIVDTPGLNAVGAEPELTVNLIAQAHAVIFLLAADTGVTRSDLAIWRDHLLPSHREGNAHLVVLNKMDTLWDSLDSPAEVQAQLQRQRSDCAQTLGIQPARILPLSAQKGLVAKIEGRQALLAQSGLPLFEDLLAQGILAHRQGILRAAVADGVGQLQAQVLRAINIRRRDLDEQMQELRSLRGKNATVIQTMRARIVQEQKTFEASHGKILAVRNVHFKLLQKAFVLLGGSSLRAELKPLAEALEQPGLKFGARGLYQDCFVRLRELAARVQGAGAEIQQMLGGTFKQLNAEFGFSLQAPGPLLLHDFLQELERLETSYLHYLGLGHAWKLASPVFGQRLVKALHMRLRTLFESAANDLDLWSKSATAQLDAQLKERKRSFARRIEAVDRIQQAASGLIERLAEIEVAERQLEAVEQRLAQWTQQLLASPRPLAADADQPPDTVSA